MAEWSELTELEYVIDERNRARAQRNDLQGKLDRCLKALEAVTAHRDRLVVDRDATLIFLASSRAQRDKARDDYDRS